MIKNFILDYWIDDGWYVGKLREVPGVFSQGETFEELKLNIKDAFALMTDEMLSIPVQNFKSAELQIEVP
ncbi:MAG: HicB family protein [Desulfobacteraceae bacterium 4572_130]|nr:MAG: HicB family protein [Desulfobacteraceae bacterium 4572_130]